MKTAVKKSVPGADAPVIAHTTNHIITWATRSLGAHMNTRGNHHQHTVPLVTRTATVMALIASLLVWGATTAPEAAAAESTVEVTTVNASPTELAVPVMSDDAAEVAYAQPSSEDHEIAVKNLATGTVEVLETTGGYRPGYTGIQALAADTDASVVAYQANDTDLDDYGAVARHVR